MRLIHGIDGTVIVDVFVDESGKIIDSRTLTKLGYGLEESAQAAVRTCPAQPVQFALLPVKSELRVPVSFPLN